MTHRAGPAYRDRLPQLEDSLFLTDSGLETHLIFHGGFELPEFAAFVLVDDARGRAALERYYREHLDIAAEHGCGVVLETPTWRASRDWGARIGYSPEELRRVNRDAVALLEHVRQVDAGVSSQPVVISGSIGPRADAYRVTERMTEDEAEEYHQEQVDALADTDVDMVHAMTITYAAEGIGIVRAADRAGVPVAVSFTTETDGRLPDGTSLTDAIGAVEADAASAPVYYGVNCAHPSHFASALPLGAPGARIRCIRANASRMSHAQLDEAPFLDDGDPVELAADYARLRSGRPAITILGGCCGTDARHVQAIADTCHSLA
jgi:homocysteine S-methyltransferase